MFAPEEMPDTLVKDKGGRPKTPHRLALEALQPGEMIRIPTRVIGRTHLSVMVHRVSKITGLKYVYRREDAHWLVGACADPLPRL